MSAYVGDGLNRWPAVHQLDAARAYRLAIEANAIGGRFHAVAGEGIASRDIAAWIGRHLDVPDISKSSEEAAEHFGWFAGLAALNAPDFSAWTRERLDWSVRSQDCPMKSSTRPISTPDWEEGCGMAAVGQCRFRPSSGSHRTGPSGDSANRWMLHSSDEPYVSATISWREPIDYAALRSRQRELRPRAALS